MGNKEKIEAAIAYFRNMSFGGDYTEMTQQKEYIALAIAALEKELSEMEVSE